MYINDKPLSYFDGELQYGYTVSGVSLDTAYSAIGQFPVLFEQRAGLKTIKTTITFYGKNTAEAYQKYSLFCHEVTGKPEIILPDNAMYSAILTEISDEVYVTDGIMDATFSFVGTKHGPKQTVTGNQLYCASTLPKTDCILSVTVGKTGKNYKLGSVTFPTVTAKERLCIDGITKRILVNGVPAAQRAEWLEFPYLKPGINNITCQDTVTAEFFPAYF